MATKPKPPLKIDNLERLRADLAQLAAVEVLVGFPEDSTERKVPSTSGEPTNAALGYIHDHGAPEVNIPARPFMIPGILSARDRLSDELEKLADAVVRGKKGPKGRNLIEVGFHRVGLLAQAALRNKINEGVPPPLSEYTLRQRAARGRKGAQAELDNRAKGLAPSTQLAKPLIDSGQFRNAINYVIRRRKERK